MIQVVLLGSLGLLVLFVPVHQDKLTVLLGIDFQVFRCMGTMMVVAMVVMMMMVVVAMMMVMVVVMVMVVAMMMMVVMLKMLLLKRLMTIGFRCLGFLPIILAMLLLTLWVVLRLS